MWASGLAAIGKLFNSLFGWDYMVAVVIGAIVIISYTSVGGFSAVATMDLIQSIIMTIALCIIVIFGVVQAGGFDAVIDHAKTLPGFLSFGQTYNEATGQAEPLRPAPYRIHDGLGPGLFRDAPYSGAFYGDPG